jgi:D-sedoheptulose 7-phosphate isomerase
MTEHDAMTDAIRRTLEAHLDAAKALAQTDLSPLVAAGELLVRALRNGGTILVLGNGGSAADAQHFAAELMGRYRNERQGFRAIALTTDTSVLTALGNDYGFEEVFARQVRALARKGDVVVGLSTSGNSDNVVRALAAARERGAATIVLGGASGGRMVEHADIAILVPANDTPRIQEGHITLIHAFCELVDETIAGR